MTDKEIQEKRKSLARKMVDAKTPEELDSSSKICYNTAIINLGMKMDAFS